MDQAALLCNICPKRPKFSDISHLLTHIASKAHLSHYFKLQVRSHQDVQAVTLLQEYDRWYKTNNLAKLLSDRMSSKDGRKKKPQGKNLIPLDKINQHRPAGGQETPSVTTTHTPQSSFPEYLDPRLSASYLGMGMGLGLENGCALTPINSNTPETTPITSHHAHHEANVGMTMDSFRSLGQWTQKSGDKGYPVLHTPPWRAVDKQNPRGFGYDPFIDDNESLDDLNTTEADKERADEIARLKGVLWPGMDIFDSATEHMRRKRNQKKDESILKMMEKTSLCVEPTELVFSPTGILRRQRVISGNVEDSSPLKGETPIPKRRASRPKRILAQADPNVQHGARKRSKRMMSSLHEDSNRHFKHPSQSPLFEPLAPYGELSRTNDFDDFSLSFLGQDPKSRTGLKVFRDGPPQYKAASKDRNLGRGGDSGLPVPFDSSFVRQGAFDHATYQAASPGEYAAQAQAALLSTDKENIEPLLDSNGRIDSLVNWYSPVAKRPFAASQGSSAPCFFADPQHLGLSPFDSHDGFVGYSFNPLASSYSKASCHDNPVYHAEKDEGFQPQPAMHATSPEGTISDVEEDDFERLYLDGVSC